MRKVLNILLMCVLALAIALPCGAQSRSTAKKTTTTQRKTTTTQRRTTTTQRKATTQKKTTTKQTTQKKATQKGKQTSAQPTYTNANIKNLQSQRQQIQKQIRQQEQALKANQADVKQRLQNLIVLNSAIDERQRSIEGIQKLADIVEMQARCGFVEDENGGLMLFHSEVISQLDSLVFAS